MLRRMPINRRASWSVQIVSYLRNSYLLLVALFWLCRVRFGLWRSPFQELHAQLSFESRKKLFYPFRTRPPLRHLIWAVDTSGRLMPDDVKCLAKALCAQAMAQQFNYDLDLRIGVAKPLDQSLDAHAWVVYQDRIILGNLPDLDKFIPLLSLPASPAEGTA